jgi:lipopolysaccharide/colanic/teichoic acid biosynthesis glycosyltransferase
MTGEEYATMSSVPETCRSEAQLIAADHPLWKSVMDFVLALVLLLPSMFVVAVAMMLVRLTSRGSPLYCQTRLGLGGRPFTIYKIRTMYFNCERLTGPRWWMPGDPRVTWIGRLLRATHIDELPQLWNILRGEMSLVGPRPERPAIATQLERVLPRYRERLRVRPGVTGLAQVQLPPDTDLASVRRKLACDLAYIAQVNPWLDLRLIIATALGILGTPTSVTCGLLRIPTGKDVEAAYPEGSGEMDVLTGKIDLSSTSSSEMDVLIEGTEPLAGNDVALNSLR